MEFAFAVELQAFAASATFIGVFWVVPLTHAAIGVAVGVAVGVAGAGVSGVFNSILAEASAVPFPPMLFDAELAVTEPPEQVID